MSAKPKEVKETLLHAINDSVLFVRFYAARALSKVADDPRVKDALRKLLADSHEEVQQVAARALGINNTDQ